MRKFKTFISENPLWLIGIGFGFIAAAALIINLVLFKGVKVGTTEGKILSIKQKIVAGAGRSVKRADYAQVITNDGKEI